VLFVFTCLFGSTLAAGSEATEVAWQNDWPRFRLTEAAVTAGLVGGIASVVLFVPAPEKAHIDWSPPFDVLVRNGLRLHSRSARRATAETSDDIYYALAAYPVVIDVPVAFAVHGSTDVALQLALMDAEAYAFTGLLAASAERAGRARPMARECGRDPDYDYKCAEPDRLNLSFMSGHTAVSFTSAGLVCAHHQHLPLFGGGPGDIAACATTVVAATTAGVLRVMSDNHYGSDVVLGGAIGFAVGYLLPTLLHYGFSGKAQRNTLEPRFRAESGGVGVSGAVVPVVGPDYAGVAVIGIAD
jgi:membrane-associated phospholipid phosphatase